MKHTDKLIEPRRRARPERVTAAASALLAIAMALAPAGLAAQTATKPQADEIVRKLEENQTYPTATARLVLDVKGRLGSSRSEFTTYSRKRGDVLVVITSGHDKGQKVLRQGGNVYLYYPEAEEVIWLKGSALRDSIMGSDFSYEDLTEEKTILDGYAAEYLGDEEIDGAACARVMLTAKTRNETYAKKELWIDLKLFVARKSVLYSASGKAIRELVSSDVRTVSGKNVPFSSVMTDLVKKGSSTAMTLVSIEIGAKIPDSYFNREELSW